ncbi:MAG: ABC transporter ATP-binding protein [Methanosarcinales archaeon]
MILDVEGVVSGYGKMMIVHDVSIKVHETEIVVLIGPNGSGKSTLIKTIFGLLKPTKGKIIFRGMDITGFKPYEIVRKGIGYVPQLDNVFPTLTVNENLEMGGYIYKNIDKREVFKIFPILKEKKDEIARNLSGGERQMLAIARALMTNPKLLLLDEPSAGLAPKLVDRLMEKIMAIRERGSSILLIEQNAKKALQISDRGYVMAMGKKVFEGTANDILDHKEIGKLYLGKK